MDSAIGFPNTYPLDSDLSGGALSRFLFYLLKPLTDEFGHKGQCTENFIDAMKTIQIPDDHKLSSVL